MTQETLLHMEQISRSFPGVRALDRVNFELIPGEVHALVAKTVPEKAR